MTTIEPLTPPRARKGNALPSLLVVVGDFGRQVIAACRWQHIPPSGVPGLPALWAGPGGWSVLNVSGWPSEAGGRPGASDGQPYPPAATWWQEHTAGLDERVAAALVEARRRPSAGGGFARDPALVIDIYLAVDLLDPFGRGLLFPLLAYLRRFASRVTRVVFTLVLACDTSMLCSLERGPAGELRDCLSRLEAELIAHANLDGLARIGWCYMLDTFDAVQRPLAALNGASPAASPAQLRAELAAEWLHHLFAGLRVCSVYQQTSIGHMNIAFRNRPPAAWTSAVGVASLRLTDSQPPAEIVQSLVLSILHCMGAGSEQPADLATALGRRARLLEELPLGHPLLRTRIGQDAAGQPLRFFSAPPHLRDLAPGKMLDAILNWDILLARRWALDDSPAALMTKNADEVLRIARIVLDRHLEETARGEMGGARVALLVVLEARRWVVEQAAWHEPPQPVMHWLAHLLARPKHAECSPFGLPDQSAGVRELAAALNRRLLPLAVFAQAAFEALLFTSFAWAYGLSAGWLEPGKPLGLALAAVVCWLACLLAGELRVLGSEQAIYTAASRLVDKIRRKYSALMERQQREEQERVYAGLLAHLEDWRVRLEQARDGLNQAQAQIEVGEGITCSEPQAPFRLNHPAARHPQVDLPVLAELAELARRFCEQGTRPGSPNEPTPILATRLAAFCRAELVRRMQPVIAPAWLLPLGPASAVLRELEELVCPAWSLSEEERAQVLAARAESQLGTVFREQASPVTRKIFAGLPEELGAEVGGEVTAYDSPPGEVLFAVSLHGLELTRLHALAGLWDELPAACPGARDEIIRESHNNGYDPRTT